MVYDGAIFSMVGSHGDIPKVKGLVKLYENRLEETTPPIGVACDVGFTPTIPVGNKHIGRERVTLGAIIFETLAVTPKVEALTIHEGVVLYEELMLTIG